MEPLTATAAAFRGRVNKAKSQLNSHKNFNENLQKREHENKISKVLSSVRASDSTGIFVYHRFQNTSNLLQSFLFTSIVVKTKQQNNKMPI